MIDEFRKFLLRGNVIDLAVAVVIGTAFTAIVTAIVEGLITPLLGVFGGIPDFAGWTFTINNSQFLIGRVTNAIVSFIILALVLFVLVIKPSNMLMERMNRDKMAEPEAPSTEEKLLMEIRDALVQGRPRVQ